MLCRKSRSSFSLSISQVQRWLVCHSPKPFNDSAYYLLQGDELLKRSTRRGTTASSAGRWVRAAAPPTPAPHRRPPRERARRRVGVQFSSVERTQGLLVTGPTARAALVLCPVSGPSESYRVTDRQTWVRPLPPWKRSPRAALSRCTPRFGTDDGFGDPERRARPRSAPGGFAPREAMAVGLRSDAEQPPHTHASPWFRRRRLRGGARPPAVRVGSGSADSCPAAARRALLSPSATDPPPARRSC